MDNNIYGAIIALIAGSNAFKPLLFRWFTELFFNIRGQWFPYNRKLIMQKFTSMSLAFKPWIFAVAIPALLSMSVPASASLLGDDFNWAFAFDCFPAVPECELVAPTSGVGTGGTPVNTVFDVIPAGGDQLPVTMLFGASTLDLSVNISGFESLNTNITWDFTGLQWRDPSGDPIPGGMITNVALSGGNGSINTVTHTTDSIQINTVAIFDPDITTLDHIATWSFDITAFHPPGPGPGPGPDPGVPEPASVLLMGLGLAGLGFSRRRRSTAQVRTSVVS